LTGTDEIAGIEVLTSVREVVFMPCIPDSLRGRRLYGRLV
jgi:hypothetical protein